MRVMKWSAIALAVTAASTQLATAAPFVSDQADAKGFVEGSTLDLKLRNYYYNRDKKDRAQDDRDWTQGIWANFSTGYTQGTIGVGVEAFGYAGLKLWGPDKYSGSGNLATSADGADRDNKDTFGKIGGAVKFRISKTELKVGDMQPTSPVFAVGGSRLLPQTASGLSLQSSEIAGLDLEAGHFTPAQLKTLRAMTVRSGRLMRQAMVCALQMLTSWAANMQLPTASELPSTHPDLKTYGISTTVM